MSTVDTNALVKIQSLWRGRLTRKRRRRENVSAIVIQRMFRGSRSRIIHGSVKDRLEEMEKNQKMRLQRMKRIREKERELTMIKRIPADDFLYYNRLRRDSSARVIQRLWRRTLGHRWNSPKPLVYTSYTRGFFNRKGIYLKQSKQSSANDGGFHGGDEAPSVKERKRKILERFIHDLEVASRLDASTSDYHELFVQRLEDDPMALEPIYRRVVDSTARKMKEALTQANKENRFSLSSPTGVRTARHKFQDLIRTQHQAYVAVDDYIASIESSRAKQVTRTTALGRCNKLIEELTKPPSLEEAKERMRSKDRPHQRLHLNDKNASRSVKNLFESTNPTGLAANIINPSDQSFRSQNVETIKKSQSIEYDDHNPSENWYHWMKNVPQNGLSAAIDHHVRTAVTITDKSRWGVVAAPHDIMGPPIDVATIPLSYKNKSLQFSETELVHEMKESLLWVSYASQQSKYVSKSPIDTNSSERFDQYEASNLHDFGTDDAAIKELLSQWLSVGQRVGNLSQQQAQDVLGEVIGRDLLSKISENVAKLRHRRKEWENVIKQEYEKREKLAKMYQERVVLDYLRKFESGLQARSELERERRGKAAVKIQSILRGRLARNNFNLLKAEKRVMQALHNLVIELSQPELRSTQLSNLQVDQSLLTHLRTIQNTFRHSNDDKKLSSKKYVSTNQISTKKTESNSVYKDAASVRTSGVLFDLKVASTDINSTDDHTAVGGTTDIEQMVTDYALRRAERLINEKLFNPIKVKENQSTMTEAIPNEPVVQHSKFSDSSTIISQSNETLAIIIPTQAPLQPSSTTCTPVSSPHKPYNASIIITQTHSNAPSVVASPAHSSSHTANLPPSSSLISASPRNLRPIPAVYATISEDTTAMYTQSTMHAFQSQTQSQATAQFDSNGLQMQHSFQSKQAMEKSTSLVDYGNPIVSLPINPDSPVFSKVLQNVENRFRDKTFQTASILTASLIVDVKLFNKVAAFTYLINIIKPFGLKALTNAFDYIINLQQEQVKSGSIRSAYSMSSNNELSVRDVALLFGELGHELNQILIANDSSASPLFPSNEFDQFCVLVRLLAGAAEGGNGSGKMKINDLYLLMEDLCLSDLAMGTAETQPIRTKLLETVQICRYTLLHQGLKSSLKNDEKIDEIYSQVQKKLTVSKTFAFDTSQFVDAKLLLALLMRILELGFFSVGGITVDRVITERQAKYLLHLIALDSTTQVCSFSLVRSCLCCTISFRILQMKLQTWYRAMPNVLDSFNPNSSILSYFTGRTSISTEAFLGMIQSSNVPLSNIECLMISQLLSRDISHSGVNIKLLHSIKKGEFISMKLA